MVNSPPDPEQEFQIAQNAFRQKDFPHALHHLAWALTADAANTRYLNLLKRIIKQARKPLDLVPAQQSMSYAEAAVRSYILADRGDIEQAIGLMLQVLRATPDVPHLPWLINWLTDTKKIRRLSPQTMNSVLSSLGMLADTAPKSRAQLVQIIPNLEKYVQAHQKDGLLIGLFSAFVRRLGKREKAIAYARMGYQTTPGYFTAVILGGAYRDTGLLDEAVAAYKKALEHDPNNVEVRLDIADILCDMEHVEQGLGYYEQVLSRTPDHPWAAVKYYFHQYQRTRDESWKDKLAKFVQAHPDDAHASHMLGVLGDPFIDFLPEPTDATLGILRQLVDEKVKPSSGINMGLSAMESPSARMAVEMYIGHPMTVSVADIQSPDPRYPRREVKYLLWKYAGTDPIRAVDPPRQAAIDAVLSLFHRPYSLHGWADLAKPIAAQLGTDYLKDLLGVMVYPPEPEKNAPTWMWIYRLQMAAALIIAQLDEPWSTSRRREALISVALGPMDWTIDAALVALLSVCLRTEEARADMIEVVRELVENPPQPGAVLYLGALVHCGLQLPDLPPDLREKLENEKQYLYS